jgi:hypothetical protein
MEVSRIQQHRTEMLQASQRKKVATKESMMAEAFKDKKAETGKASPSKPVMNGQNQVIGSRLNVSA